MHSHSVCIIVMLRLEPNSTNNFTPDLSCSLINALPYRGSCFTRKVFPCTCVVSCQHPAPPSCDFKYDIRATVRTLYIHTHTHTHTHTHLNSHRHQGLLHPRLCYCNASDLNKEKVSASFFHILTTAVSGNGTTKKRGGKDA